MDRFIHLHVHSVYSFLDGMCKFNELINKAKKLGMDSVALTDHNHLGGTFEFQRFCLRNGIKPILGFEGYYNEHVDFLIMSFDERRELAAGNAFADGVITFEEFELVAHNKKCGNLSKKSVEDKIKDYMPDLHQYHVIFIAMNQVGWKNLVKLQSEAAERCTYNGRFTCDDEMMAKYSDGIICTTACIASRVAKLITKDNDYIGAERLVLKWYKIFGDRFYLEIQPLVSEDQIKVNAFYYSMCRKYGLPVIATTDVHYINETDYADHDVLIAMGTGSQLNDSDRMRYVNNYWFKSFDEMINGFKEQLNEDRRTLKLLPDNYMEFVECCLYETGDLADRIDADIRIVSESVLVPQVKLAPGETAESVLELRCRTALEDFAKKDRFIADHIDLYRQRLSDELEVIIPKQFASYLLVVAECIEWADANGVCTGPGRGSAAGSLCLYLLGITKMVDPIRYNLLFSRFLTKDRTSPPDIDCDYSWLGRGKLIEHLKEYYGNGCVAHIGTYTVLGVKSGLKDVGRVLGIPFDVMNRITKQLDEIADLPAFSDYDNLAHSELKSDQQKYDMFIALQAENSELFRLARRFEGIKRNFGVHASGILAMPFPVTDMIPVRISDGIRVCLYTGPEIEDLNCIKLDVLGLKTLDVINMTLQLIGDGMDYASLYAKLNLDDEIVYKMLADGKTDAVFQFESGMFKKMMNDIIPESIDDLIAVTSLGRPGPLSAGMPQDYAQRKKGIQAPVPLLRGMEEILVGTYGEIIYQEQIMLIGVKAFGFNMNQADSIIRKTFAKKKKAQLEMLRRMMFYGKLNTDGPEGWKDNPDLPWYDPDGKGYGDEICGGIANGYSLEELEKFWNSIQGFSEYLFNKSHAACYSYISFMTAWLKCYYPVEFFAAVLSIQDDAKTEKYIDVCSDMGIKVLAPDINVSGKNFQVSEDRKNIYYGLLSVKGVGEAVVDLIVKNRPYNSLEDLFERIPKKFLNKSAVYALAKSGAFDRFDDSGNRYKIINRIIGIRKDKEKLYNEAIYSSSACIELEQEVLICPVTYPLWWNKLKQGQNISADFVVVSYKEQRDKRNNLMCFAKLLSDGCKIDAVLFASVYSECKDLFNFELNPLKVVSLKGYKDNKGKFIVKGINNVFSENT